MKSRRLSKALAFLMALVMLSGLFVPFASAEQDYAIQEEDLEILEATTDKMIERLYKRVGKS